MPESALDGVLRDGYDTGGFYDETFEHGPKASRRPRAHYAELVAQIASMDGRGRCAARPELANRSFLHRGVTFTVYSDEDQGTERILPFDPIPRIIPADEWAVVEAGPAAAHPGAEPVRPRHLPRAGDPAGRRSCRAELVVLGRHFRREVVGIDVPDDQYIARRRQRPGPRRRRPLDGARGQPAHAQRRLLRAREPADDDAHLPRLVRRARRPLRSTPMRGSCSTTSRALAARAVAGAASGPTVVVLTPGVYNSAYFEHAFLAQQMGVELVEGRDLFVLDEPRLHAHDARTPTGGRDLPPRRRRVPRPAGLPPRVDARRRRAARRRAAPATSRSPTRSAPASPTTRSIYRYVPGDHPLLPRRGADPRQRADVPAERSGATRVRAATTSTRWSSRRPTRAAATGC